MLTAPKNLVCRLWNEVLRRYSRGACKTRESTKKPPRISRIHTKKDKEICVIRGQNMGFPTAPHKSPLL